MIVKLTYAERDTILAALRRWQSYPAAREADSIATGGRKHRPLDNAEIERICKRMTKTESKRDAAPLPRQSNNGDREKKASKIAR
jgi:NH3-dependent NAD+ synthetase